MTPETKKKDVGDLLLEKGVLTEKHLELVRRRQARLQIPQHQSIVDLNYASEEETYRALAELNNLEFVDPTTLDLNKAILQLVPVKLVLHYRLVPIGQENGQLLLAGSELLSLGDQGNLRLLLGKRLKQIIASPSSIHAVIKKHYGLGADTIQQLRDDRGTADAAH